MPVVVIAPSLFMLRILSNVYYTAGGLLYVYIISVLSFPVFYVFVH